MRNLAVLVFFLAAIAVTIQHPWLGVLALAVFSYLNPHEYTWGFMRDFPVYQTLVIVAFIMLFASKKEDRQPLPSDWRIPAFFTMWAYFFITTLNAKVPFIAWFKLLEVSKIYLPFILTLLLINTRKKLFYLIATITLSFGLVGVKGGIWAISTGFAHRVHGPPDTQFYGNNEIAIALLMTIPLLILCFRELKQTWLRNTIVVSIPLIWVAALTSWSRGALLATGVLALVLLWHGRRKYLIVPLAALGIYVMSGALPEKWYARMYTIETYEQDSSAMTRIYIWRDGLDYAKEHWLLGGGFESWYGYAQGDWHSSYIEILADHGVIAFTLWMSLLFGSMLSLTRLAALGRRHRRELPWITNYATMLRASLIAYASGAVFLGISYWDILYHLVFISVLAKKFALEEIAGLETARAVDSSEAVSGDLGAPRKLPTFSR